MNQLGTQSHRTIATIATLLFSMSGLTQLRSMTRKSAYATQTIDYPGRDERIARILSLAQSERQKKLTRRAARHHPCNF